MGEVSEFDPVVHPLPTLQQVVKREGEPSKCQCAGDLYHQQCGVKPHLRFALQKFVCMLKHERR